MKIFHCQSCTSSLYFENIRCLACGNDLGFCPDLQELSVITPAGTGEWRAAAAPQGQGLYRKCAHFTDDAACNWMIPPGDSGDLCRSCALTRTMPDITTPDVRRCWIRLEAAKRRLYFGLAQLHLPIVPRDLDGAHGMCFDFLVPTADRPVVTGHNQGVITINTAEADDAQREASKVALGEAYRTVLGHLRHESGHYYWDVLIDRGGRHEAFRALFGDERQAYDAAAKRYYSDGPPPQWNDHFISAYATMHPWEDWAETWAHYLHIRDVIEIGGQFHVSLRPKTSDMHSATVRLSAVSKDAFDQIIDAWIPFTYVANSLNRSMGFSDWYPFTLSDEAIAKVRFVHDTILAAVRPRPSVRAVSAAPASPAKLPKPARMAKLATSTLRG
jgi:hypothetical protein